MGRQSETSTTPVVCYGRLLFRRRRQVDLKRQFGRLLYVAIINGRSWFRSRAAIDLKRPFVVPKVAATTTSTTNTDDDDDDELDVDEDDGDGTAAIPKDDDDDDDATTAKPLVAPCTITNNYYRGRIIRAWLCSHCYRCMITIGVIFLPYSW